MNHTISEIDRLIREEKRLTAVESHNEAWAEGLSAGIEPEIIAEAALATALAELVPSCGGLAPLGNMGSTPAYSNRAVLRRESLSQASSISICASTDPLRRLSRLRQRFAAQNRAIAVCWRRSHVPERSEAAT
jgi:hypothetical protein